MDMDHLPVEEAAYLLTEIEQEMADLARGVLPPKFKFAPLRKATIDRALAELGFTQLGASWVLDLRGFRVAVEVFRDKSNRSFCIDLGLQPLTLWDDAAHSAYPAHAALFRGRVTLEGNRSWWKHGLDADRAKEVLAIAAEFIGSQLLTEVDNLIDYCDSATPELLASPPRWLDPLGCGPAAFARYRHAAGRAAEAAAFAHVVLERLRDDTPLGRLKPTSPIELEMRSLAEG
jgi:hypothetical protein